jgi:hypothetical protein
MRELTRLHARLGNSVTAEVLLKGMSREKSPLRLDADPFLSRHSAQLFERALLLREWSCSG